MEEWEGEGGRGGGGEAGFEKRDMTLKLDLSMARIEEGEEGG